MIGFSSLLIFFVFPSAVAAARSGLADFDLYFIDGGVLLLGFVVLLFLLLLF